MDWSRKHLGDLAALCKVCEEDPALPMSQRRAFTETYLLTKQFSSLPMGGGVSNVATVIARLCGACQDAYSHSCVGRSGWQQPCPLIRQYIHQQPQ